MKRRRWLHTTLLAALLAVPVGSACGDEVAPALIVTGNIIPDEEEGICTVQTEGGAGGQQSLLLRGILDLSIQNRYRAFIGVRNNFEAFSTLTGFQPSDGRLAPDTVTLTGADVRLEINEQLLLQSPGALTALGALGLGIPITYSVAGSGTAQPDSDGVMLLELIPPGVGQALRSIAETVSSDLEILLVIRAKGVRQDGRKIRSGPFRYPIRLCNNCRVSHEFPPDVAANPFNPPNADPLDPEDLGIRCYRGQDEVVTNAVCGAFWPEAGSCGQERCFGRAPSGDLTCPEDRATITPGQALPPG